MAFKIGLIVVFLKAHFVYQPKSLNNHALSIGIGVTVAASVTVVKDYELVKDYEREF